MFQLLNQDGDTGSVVQIRNIENIIDEEGMVSPIFPTNPQIITPGTGLELTDFTETENVAILFQNQELNPTTGEYSVEVQIQNNGAPISRNVAIVFPNLPEGVALVNASGSDENGHPYVNLQNAIPTGGLSTGKLSEPILVKFTNPNLVPFNFNPQILVGGPNIAPNFPTLSSFTVKPGERLTIPLLASDSNGDKITFSLETTGSLPNGVLQGNGTLEFAPTPEEVGTYTFTVTASDGVGSTSQEVTLEVVADAVTTIRISGKIEDVNQSPLEGVVVELGDLQSTTDSDGTFTIETNEILTSDTLIVRGDLLSGAVTYPYIAEKLPLVLGKEVYSGHNNVISRPIYLPKIDTENTVTINPEADTTVTTAAIPGAEVVVSAGSLENQAGEMYRGKLGITQVPNDLTPAALPPNLVPDLVVTIQPGEMVFNTPAPLSLPNLAGYAPRTIMDLWSINPETGDFDKVGVGRVSEDGTVVETIEGGIINSSWHFFTPPPEEPNDPDEDPRNEKSGCKSCNAPAPLTSEVELHSGAVIETHDLVTYQSLGGSRGLTLTYDSLRADPRSILHFGYENVERSRLAPGFEDKLRLLASLTIHGEDFDYEVPGFAGGEYGLQGGEHFWSLTPGSGSVSAALQADLSHLPSGNYPYSLTSGIRLFVRNQFNGSSSTTTGKLLHINGIDSAFGSGWSLAGLMELVENEDGSILLIDGDGSELLFEAPSTKGDGYIAPPGAFSTLEKLQNGTFRLTEKNKTVQLFNENNQLVSVTDSDGNVTQYVYDKNGLLTEIIDPAGLETTFTYTSGKVTAITDPAGRVTQLQYDEFGNLISVTDPDNSTRTWEYDNFHHLVAEVDQRGNREETVYNFAGRAVGATRKDGSVVRVNPVQTQGLYSPEATINPLSSPVAGPTNDAVSSYANGNGNVRVTELDQAGQLVNAWDREGLLPSVARNKYNLVTSRTNGRGFVTTYKYDEQGNVLRIQDEAGGNFEELSTTALSFDGIDDYGSFGNTVGNFGVDDFTVEFWINTTATDSGSIIVLLKL